LGDWVSGAIDPVDCQQFGFYPLQKIRAAIEGRAGKGPPQGVEHLFPHLSGDAGAAITDRDPHSIAEVFVVVLKVGRLGEIEACLD
jgi:hypothetical protein